MTDGVDGGPRPIPAAEFDVTDELVRMLLAAQHPDLAERGLRMAANGWDNVIYRLGDDLAVRLPRRAAGATLVEHEQRWLPELAPRLPLPIPAPVRIGLPGLGYPWRWSVTPWFAGQVAADARLIDPTLEARRLGAFMSALHVVAPEAAPSNPVRDSFVGDRSERFDAAWSDASQTLDAIVPDGSRRTRRRWDELVGTPRFDGRPVWVAGDVHTANIVVAQGEIIAVIDFGDICAGDPAVDLAVAWMLFGEADRRVFREAASHGASPVDDAMWRRAEAWAWHFAMLYLANSADLPRQERIGRDLVLALVA